MGDIGLIPLYYLPLGDGNIRFFLQFVYLLLNILYDFINVEINGWVDTNRRRSR
jgi:hypothetical protein